jgi:hypothetical protein
LNANPGYVSVAGQVTKVTPIDFANALKRLYPNQVDLQTAIYTISYIRTYQSNSNTNVGSFNGWNNNLGTLSLNQNWSGQVSLIERNYSCVNIRTNPSTTSSEPIAHFESLDKYITFMAGRLQQNIDRIVQLGLAKYYVCYWPKSNVSEQYYDTNKTEFNKVRETFAKALTSATDAGLISKDTVIKFNSVDKKVENEASTPGVTPTPSPIPPEIGQTCPPPVISTFSPSAGNTGTIVQVNGRNFESVKSIRVINKDVELKDITVFNPQTLRFTLPAVQIPEGQSVATGRISITTEYGTFESLVDFTFNPSLPNETSSPGGYADTTTQQQLSIPQQEVIGENMNPQQTGPSTFVSTTIPLNESKTQSLSVKINPELSGWIMGATVDQNAQVYVLEESNNQVTRKKVTQKIQGIGGQVTNNEFNITLSDIESFYLDGVPRIEGKTQIDIIFTVYAYKGAESPVKRQFPFRIWYTLPNQNQVPVENIPVNQTLPTFPQQQLSIVRLPDSDTIQGEGQTYYNIKKPSGGYITFNFTLPSGQSYQSQNEGGISILDNNYDSVPFSSFGGSNTRYTNEMTIKSKGVFRLQIKYYPYGFTSPIGGEVLEQIVVSDIFTL